MSAPATGPAAKDQPRKNGHVLQYAWDFTKNLWKDTTFQSRVNAIPDGANFVVQGACLALFTAFFGIHVLSIAAGVGLAGIGLAAVGYGFAKSWMSLEGICERSFPKFNPLRKIRSGLPKITLQPLLQKINRHLPEKYRFTPAKQESLLASITLEGSIVLGATLTLHTLHHLAAVPALTAGTILTGGMAFAAGMTAWCAYDAFCATKTLFDTYRKYKEDKKARGNKTPKPAVTAPPMQESIKTAAAKTAAAFNTEAVRQEAEQTATRTMPAARSYNPIP